MWARPDDVGSSPLARGLLTTIRCPGCGCRIIPARAGFTPAIEGRPRDPRDHPRSRGVYGRRSCRGCSGPGSSPLARGLRGSPRHRPHAEGIIPARAGFTSWSPARTASRPDHPRSRGVYASRPVGCFSSGGSSPLARGLRLEGPLPARALGIIPARAGFTPPRSLTAPRAQDHPRSRGVYWGGQPSPWTTPGSSPLARGLQEDREGAQPQEGIIPARAGFTWRRATRGRGATDHPRSRGVYRRSASARKTPSWIIPARAGFTPPCVWTP